MAASAGFFDRDHDIPTNMKDKRRHRYLQLDRVYLAGCGPVDLILQKFKYRVDVEKR
jgi:hypothetical protein